MRRNILQGQNRIKDEIKDFVNPEETDLIEWASSMYYELERVKETFVRKGEPEMFEYFVRRLMQYKRDFVGLNTSGDFALVKRSIMAEIRIEEFDTMSPENVANDPKLFDAITKLHTQLMKDVEAVGATSKQRRKEQLDTLKVIVDHKGLQNVKEDEAETEVWIAQHTAIPG